MAILIAMPELPEVEHLLRSLESPLLDARIECVELRRRDIVRTWRQGPLSKPARISKTQAKQLLASSRITQLLRHGKNLVIVADTGRVLCVHLGMSGQLVFVRSREQLKDKHIHCVWTLRRDTKRVGWLVFRDPRRFGGLWTFESIEHLRDSRLARLGPDALSIQAVDLKPRLACRKRAIKAALLDQTTLAGVGNIYADEALFHAKIHPRKSAHRMSDAQIEMLVQTIRQVLTAAVNGGGSSIRSYIDGNGHAGSFAAQHVVYGRAGQPCLRCRSTLRATNIAQRTTVFCPLCQSRS